MSDGKALYSMDEITQETGIAYATLSRFLRKHGDRIPSEMRGRARFFPPRALEIVEEIVRENAARRGRKLRRRSPEKAASDEAMACLDRATKRLEKLKEDLDHAYGLLLNHSFSVVLSLRTLAPGLVFRHTVDVLIEPDGPYCVARLFEVNLCSSGDTRQEAMDNLRAVIVETYRELMRTDRKSWTKELRERAALAGMVRETPLGFSAPVPLKAGG
jgi:predicted RNase H-like HicB family nuclease